MNEKNTSLNEDMTLAGEDGGGIPPNLPYDPGGSFSMFNLFGEPGTIGSIPAITEESIDQTIAQSFKSLQTFRALDEWIVLMKYANMYRDITQCILKSEQEVFDDQSLFCLKPEYKATAFNQLQFTLLRAYAKADSGDFNTASILMDTIANKWIAFADDYRKPYILTQLYITSICTKEWDKSIKYLDQLWLDIKFMNPNKRHTFGIWDEWTTCLLVTWFFMKHWKEFAHKFTQNMGIGQTSLFNMQRKDSIIKNLSTVFFTETINKSYYKKAMEYSSIPDLIFKEKICATI